jgi:hypothetical protein
MTDPRIIALPFNTGQVEPGPFSEHDLREQWNAQADEFNQGESLDSSEQLAWAQTRAIAAIPGQALNVILDGPPGPEAGRFIEIETDDGRSIRAGEWYQRPDGYWALRLACRAAQVPTGPSLEEVGPLIAWLTEAAVRSADAGASKNAGMLTWAAQVVGERVDEHAPDADQVEGPSLADVAELCEEFGFMPGNNGALLAADVFRAPPISPLPMLHDMITAAITRWRAPAAQPAAQPVDVANLMRLTEGVDPFAPGDPDQDHI